MVMSVWVWDSGESLGSQCDGLLWSRRCEQRLNIRERVDKQGK